MNIGTKLGAVALAVGCGATLAATPAGAETASINHSTNAAGYETATTVPVTSFSMTVNVPTVTCPVPSNPVSDSMLHAVAEFVDPNGDFLEFRQDFVCSTSSVLTNEGATAQFCHNDGTCPPVLNVADVPGDLIHFAMGQNATTHKMTYSVNNKTAKHKLSHTATGTFPFASAEVLTTVQSTLVDPVPAFTPAIHYATVLVNGTSFAALHPARYEVFNSTGLAINSTLLAAGFSTAFKHA